MTTNETNVRIVAFDGTIWYSRKEYLEYMDGINS